MTAESWVEITRRRAVAAQIKAAAMAKMVNVERYIITARPDDGQWGAAEASMLGRLSHNVAYAYQDARHYADSYLAALASEAAMPAAWRAAS